MVVAAERFDIWTSAVAAAVGTTVSRDSCALMHWCVMPCINGTAWDLKCLQSQPELLIAATEPAVYAFGRVLCDA